jgi:flagellin FlaB
LGQINLIGTKKAEKQNKEKTMVRKFMQALENIGKGKRGITGLETAIILIAFVTVASVLGYSVLSAGIFSSEKGKQAVYQGLSQAQASMQVKGSVYATFSGGDSTADPPVAPTADSATFTLASVLNDESVDITAPRVAGVDATNTNTMVINYTDSTGVTAQNLLWTATAQGKAGTANILGPNEQVLLEVTLPDTNTLGVYDSFTLQIIPAKGAAITVQRTLTNIVDEGTIDLN